jgi:hypothetical protein
VSQDGAIPLRFVSPPPSLRLWVSREATISKFRAGSRTFEVSRKPDVAEVLARLRKYRGRLPKEFTFDRLKANER